MPVHFQGEFYNAIDAKGRTSIPARFREVLENGFGDDHLVATQEKDGVVAYPASEWRQILARVEALPPGQFRDDIYLTSISPAVECFFDKQGRIQLPKALRKYAGLDDEVKEVVVVGVSKKIAIWNPVKHAEMRAEAERRVAADPQSRSELGF